MDTSFLLNLYRHIYRSRLFEEQVVQLWNKGLITGEMHTGIGEEAINAGIVSQLDDGDALALDHRGTSPALIRGVDPKALLLEFMGHEQGLCSGNGGHMHLFSPSHLLASSGIVGASGPAGAGFALAARLLRPGSVCVAFFGEGAVNQGMLMESLNFASSLKLPVLFVCKDNGMAITTQSSHVTAGTVGRRAASFDIPVYELDGIDVETVWQAACKAIRNARSGGGPSFIHAICKRPQGHFLGDPLLRIVGKPVKEFGRISGPLLKSAGRLSGASLKERISSLREVVTLLGKMAKIHFSGNDDPLLLTERKLMNNPAVHSIREEVGREIRSAVAEVIDLVGKSA